MADAADNYFDGGAGRNLLIGGRGADTLVGGADEDILIAGTTSFDIDAVSLGAIAAYWGRTDKGYEARTQYLSDNYFRKPVNSHVPPVRVFNDRAANTLFGRGGNDWFWVRGPENPYGNYDPLHPEIKDWATGDRIDESGPSTLGAL